MGIFKKFLGLFPLNIRTRTTRGSREKHAPADMSAAPSPAAGVRPSSSSRQRSPEDPVDKRSNGAPVPLCQFFQEGLCKFGASCRNSHAYTRPVRRPSLTRVSRKSPSRGAAQGRSKTPMLVFFFRAAPNFYGF